MKIIAKLAMILILLSIFSQLGASDAKKNQTAIATDRKLIEIQEDIKNIKERIYTVEVKFGKINSLWSKFWPILLTAALSFLIAFVIYSVKRKDIYREQHLSSLLKYLSSLNPESRPQEDILFKDLTNHAQFKEISDLFNRRCVCEDEINSLYDRWCVEFEKHTAKLEIEVQVAIEKYVANLEGFVKHWIRDEQEYDIKVEFLRDATWRGQSDAAGYGIVGKDRRYLFILGAQNKVHAESLYTRLVEWKKSEDAKKAVDYQKERSTIKGKICKELERCSHIVRLNDDCKEYLG